MSLLRISLFGRVSIARDGRPSEVRLTRVNQELLAYLLLHRHRMHSREILIGLFWGELSDDRARGCLNTAVWRLRRILEADGIPRGAYIATTSTGDIGFNDRGDYWLDVGVFERQVLELLSQQVHDVVPSVVDRTETVLQLYTGDLLEGFGGDWVVCERERLHRLYLEALVQLMRYHGRRRAFDKSLTYGRLVLQDDGLREDIHREMMALYSARGQRALAVRQYQTCRDILAVELDIAPMPETQRLYEEITGKPDRPASPPSRPAPASLLGLAEQMSQTVLACEEASRLILQAARLLERAARSNGAPPVGAKLRTRSNGRARPAPE
jgi:DNA-binding SARP family transcriptional activator